MGDVYEIELHQVGNTVFAVNDNLIWTSFPNKNVVDAKEWFEKNIQNVKIQMK